VTDATVSLDKTMVFANEKIFSVAATMLFVNEKIFSVVATMVFVNKKIFSVIGKIFSVTITMVGGDSYPIDSLQVIWTRDFYHGICHRKDLFGNREDLFME
jgi:hypothetical protein